MGTSTQIIDFSNVDQLTLLVTIFVAILGWIIALVLQRSNARHQYKIQVRYDIYKQLLKCAEQTQGKINDLATIFTPFIFIESSMISFQLKIPKEYKGEWIPRNEQECLFEGEQKWTEFTRSVFDKYFAFTNQYLEMLYIFEGWAAAIEPLIKIQKIFTKEVDTLKMGINRLANELQRYTMTKGHDWRRWNKKEVEAITEKIRNDSHAIGMYLHDFMVLVHNELLSKYFKYEKPIRKTLDSSYKVLTNDGIVVRLEEDHERLLKEFEASNREQA
jgi:hypothetical protein